MKTLISFPKLAMAVAVVGMLPVACTKDDDPNPQPEKTIVEVVTSDNDFSLLAAAVTHAGLVQTLSGSGPFTVFAPTNDAFVAAGLNSAAAIQALPAETVRGILMYHVLGQAVPAASIPEAANTPIETAAEVDAYVTRKSDGSASINGSAVLQADVMATNGIIHVINKVLMPPMGNAVEALMDNDNFSMLVAAVVRASEGSTNVAEVLMGEGPFTIFAPTNQAFIDAGFSSVAAIQAADPDILTTILTYHVIPALVFSTDLVDGATPTTVNGENLSISLTDDGAMVAGNGNETPSSITQADWVTENGVVHTIDQVLMP